MKPHHFPEANTKFTKPENMTDEQCGSIAAFRYQQDNLPVIVTAFKINGSDLAQIIKYGILWVWHYSESLPPHAITAENPFVKPIPLKQAVPLEDMFEKFLELNFAPDIDASSKESLYVAYCAGINDGINSMIETGDIITHAKTIDRMFTSLNSDPTGTKI